MKITNGEVIKNGEQELIDAITGDLDWGVIEKIFKEKHRLGIEEDVEYKNGDLVVHDNQIAYKFEFDIKVTLSILLDREGNYLSITSAGDPEKDQNEAQDAPPEDSEEHSGLADVEESGQGLEDVMAELDSHEDTENNEMMSPEPAHEGSDERISRAASQAADMIAQMDNEA